MTPCICHSGEVRELRAEVERLRAALSAARPMIEAGGWQSIETAPRDGSPVLLGYFRENLDGSIYQEGGQPIVARWLPERKAARKPWSREANWAARTERLLSGDQPFAPTHWIPLPAPPKLDAQGGAE